MIYEAFFIALAASIVCVIMLLVSIKLKFEPLIVFGIMGTLVSVGVLTAAGFLSGRYMLNRSHTPFPEYTQQILKMNPDFKGTLVCNDTTISFHGIQKVKFRWEGQTYQIDYPANTVIDDIGINCEADIRPPEALISKQLQEHNADKPDMILRMLNNQEVPVSAVGQEKAVLSSVLSAIYPVSTTVADLSSSPQSKKLVVADTHTPVKVPAPQESTPTAVVIGPAIDVGQEVVNRNISGQ